jgi:hypothetical protein
MVTLRNPCYAACAPSPVSAAAIAHPWKDRDVQSILAAIKLSSVSGGQGQAAENFAAVIAALSTTGQSRHE